MRRLLPLLIFALVVGCGGWSRLDAQRAVTTGAEFTQAADEQLAPIVGAAVDRCDTEHETREDFTECVEPYFPIRFGVRLTRHALRLGQSVVDAWGLGEQGVEDWMPYAACISQGLSEVAGAVDALELDVPAVVRSILTWTQTFGALVGSACPASIIAEVQGE